MWTDKAICVWNDDTIAAVRPTRASPTTCLHGRKRGLSEMSSNVQYTPRKTARTKQDVDGQMMIPTPRTVEDVDTPRARHPLSTFIPLRPSSTGAAAYDNDPRSPAASTSQSDVSGASSSVSSRALKRKRSMSPSKDMEERRYAKLPIRHLAVTNMDLVNEKIREAVRRVKRIGRSRGVLAAKYSAEWAEHLCAGDKDLAKDMFDGDDDRDGLPPGIDRMRRIVDRAASNVEFSVGEAAWNSGVHDFLLEEALVGSRVGTDLTWENITTASMVSNLVPEKDDVERASAKKVDFCIALELRDYENLGQTLYQMGVRHLNQTEYGIVRYKPIAISIETKLPGEGGTTALVQLTTWATAQVNYLRQLHQSAGRADSEMEDATILPLPLILIQGHTWSMYYLEHHHAGNRATLWDCGHFGTTRTLSGAYQIIAALRVLMSWAAEVYQPWFEQNILQPRGFDKLQ